MFGHQQHPRWHTTLAVIFFAQVMTSVGFSLVFPFLPLYVKELGSVTGLSVEVMAGLVIGAQGFSMMLVSPLWGNLADRYGRKLMVMRASFGGAVILASMGLVQSGEQLIFVRFIQGLVTGTVAANSALVASVTPRERVGFALGTLQVGLWGGIAIGPLLGGLLADQFGYRLPFFITGGLLLLSGILVALMIERDYPQATTPAKRKAQPTMVQQWQHVLASDGVVWVYVTLFLSSMARVMIVPIAPLFVEQLLGEGATATGIAAGAVISASSATSTFSGVYLGRLGDEVGHRRVLLWAGLSAALIYVPILWVGTVWQLLVMLGLVGFALGGIISAPSALLARYTTPGEEGTVYGLNNSVGAGARSIAPIIGSTVALWFGYRVTFASAGLLMVAVAAIALFRLPNDTVISQRQPELAPSGD
jgi:DHA1 family multidrug resistance protein-like MFS transporter